MTRVLDSDLVADVTVLADGAALLTRERTVSRLRCDVCGAEAIADGIVDHLVFDHDHQHGGQP